MLATTNHSLLNYVHKCLFQFQFRVKGRKQCQKHCYELTTSNQSRLKFVPFALIPRLFPRRWILKAFLVFSTSPQTELTLFSLSSIYQVISWSLVQWTLVSMITTTTATTTTKSVFSHTLEVLCMTGQVWLYQHLFLSPKSVGLIDFGELLVDRIHHPFL